MKIRTSLIAMACLASVGAAHAVSPADIKAARDGGTLVEVRLAGASALRLLVGSYIQADLATPGSFDVFFDSATGANHRAYSFVTKADIPAGALGGTLIPAGTTMLITKRDAGGSAQGVTPLLNGGDNNQQHMLVDDIATCTRVVANPSPATDITKPSYICTGTTTGLAHAGFSDVEPVLLQSTVNGGGGLDVSGLNAGGFVQNIFGVAVNKKAYLALQKAQGLDNAGAIDESPAKVPSIPKSFVAGALTGGIAGSLPTKNGWNLLIPSTVDSNINNKRVIVCRRNQGSGTQAASNLYFNNGACGPAANQGTITLGGTSLATSATGTTTVTQNSSSGAVENCLGQTVAPLGAEGLADATGGAYALGVLGAENNPLPTDANGVCLKNADNVTCVDKGYRFVKLSQVAPNRASVIAGDYEFVVEASMQWAASGANAPTGGIFSLVQKMRNEMGKAAILNGLDADLQKGLAALPSTVSGAWSDLDATTKGFTSHTNRKSANSCSSVRMTK